MELEELWDIQLEHFGVKGMKWGKRKSVTKSSKGPGRLRKEIDSNKRELMALKELKNPGKLSDSELKSKTTRLRNENSLKRLSKKDRNTYLNRSTLSDNDLKTKVERLQLEDNLKQEVRKATSGQRAVANKVIKKVAATTLSAYTDTNGKFSATGNDIADILIRESLKYTKDKNVIHSTNSDQILEHFGVKGMKWGKRKATGHTIDVRPTSETRVHNKRQVINAPGIGGLALMVYSRHSTNKQVNQQLSAILDTPIGDIDKKSLKNAREIILNYDYIELKRSDKKKWEAVT